MHDRGPARFRPEKEKILQELKTQLSSLKADDFAVVALSGHGMRLRDDDHGYFCPADARPDDKLAPVADRRLRPARALPGAAEVPGGQRLPLRLAARPRPAGAGEPAAKAGGRAQGGRRTVQLRGRPAELGRRPSGT